MIMVIWCGGIEDAVDRGSDASYAKARSTVFSVALTETGREPYHSLLMNHRKVNGTRKGFTWFGHCSGKGVLC